MSHCWNHNSYKKTGQEEQEKWSREQGPAASLFIRNKPKASKENLAMLWAWFVLQILATSLLYGEIKKPSYRKTHRCGWAGGSLNQRGGPNDGLIPTSSRNAKHTRALPVDMHIQHCSRGCLSWIAWTRANLHQPSPRFFSLPGAFTKITYTFLWKKECVV